MVRIRVKGTTMIHQFLLGAGFFLLMTSALLIPAGVRLPLQSHSVAHFEHSVVLAGMFCFFIVGLFAAGVLVLRKLRRFNRDLALLAGGAFGLGCVIGSLLGLGEMMQSFSEGFAELGLGYFLSAAGLAAGALGAMGLCLIAPRYEADKDQSFGELS